MGKLVLTPEVLSNTPEAGLLEFDGSAPRFSFGVTNRSLIPGMQHYSLFGGIPGVNATSNQSIIGVGVTLDSNTVYEFECCFNLFKTAGTTSHRFRFGWGGTATLHRITTNILVQESSWGYWGVPTTVNARVINQYTHESAEHQEITQSMNTAFRTVNLQVRGVVRVNQGGTLIPQYSLTAAPGGEYTSSAGNCMSIWPVGPNSSNNISIGNWA